MTTAVAQTDRFTALAGSPFEQNRPTEKTAGTLREELLFQRATQTYLWAMPLLNTMGMRDGFAQSYSPTYNTMAIWTKRLDARTRITTPNSDLIYGMVFVNLAESGLLVFEAPPKLQGILLGMWQRPIPHDGGQFFGDVGLPGPDGGKGGKFLILPPGYKGEVPGGHYVYRSGTNIAPKAPAGAEANWLATVPGRGFFAILRLYAPSQPALDGSWKPGDVERVK